MRRYLIPYSIIALGACAMLYLIAPADAATLRIGTKTFTVSDETAARIQAFAAANYACLPATVDNPCPPNPNPLASMYDAILEGIKNNVRSWEAQEKLKAVAAPPDLN